jgi:hypothetical protein
MSSHHKIARFACDRDLESYFLGTGRSFKRFAPFKVISHPKVDVIGAALPPLSCQTKAADKGHCVQIREHMRRKSVPACDVWKPSGQLCHGHGELTLPEEIVRHSHRKREG